MQSRATRLSVVTGLGLGLMFSTATNIATDIVTDHRRLTRMPARLKRTG
jgi:predicted MFS family arabinose efflux permease